MLLVWVGVAWLVLGGLALVAVVAIGRSGRREDEGRGYVPAVSEWLTVPDVLGRAPSRTTVVRVPSGGRPGPD